MKEEKNGKRWLRDIRVIILLEIAILAVAFCVWLYVNRTRVWAEAFLEVPTLIGIVLITLMVLAAIGEWKYFLQAFSVGTKPHTLLELKNICGAVAACQKLAAYVGALMVLIHIITLLHNLSNPADIGPLFATALLSGLYAILLEIILLPLRIHCERKMNEEIDMEYEEPETADNTPGGSEE